MVADGTISRNHTFAWRRASSRARVLARIGAMPAVLLLAWGSPSDRALSAIEVQARESQAQELQAQEPQAREPQAEEPQAREPQAGEPQSRSGVSLVDTENLEEIIVTAPRTLRSMRTDIDEVQNRAFALFNELNVDNDYDIVCRRETPTGSHIPVRICRPRYIDRLEADASQEFFTDGVYVNPAADIMYHENILKQKLALMIEEHPEFHEALEEFYRLRTAYEDERRERFRDSWFVR